MGAARACFFIPSFFKPSDIALPATRNPGDQALEKILVPDGHLQRSLGFTNCVHCNISEPVELGLERSN
jgi:hypothetical protein